MHLLMCMLGRHLALQTIRDDYTTRGIRYSKGQGVLYEGLPYTLRVTLPTRLQKYGKDHMTGQKPIEDFTIFSTGSLFAAFAEVHNYPVSVHLGHEYREILRTQIEAETDLQCPKFGPSPIHPDFYIVFRKPAKEHPSLEPRIYSIENDVLVVIEKEDQTMQDVAIGIFFSIESLIADFYLLQITRSAALVCHSETLAAFSELVNSIKQLYSTAWWRVLKSYQLTRAGQKHLSRIHELLIDFEFLLVSLIENRQQLMEQVNHHPLLMHVAQYFKEQTQADCSVPNALSSALDHFAGELQTSGNIRSEVVAALLGAVVATILTTILSGR